MVEKTANFYAIFEESAPLFEEHHEQLGRYASIFNGLIDTQRERREALDDYFNPLEAIAHTELESACKIAKEGIAEDFNGLRRLVLNSKDTFQAQISEAEAVSFETFDRQLSELQERALRIKNPNDAQVLLDECAQQLDAFITKVKDIREMGPVLPRLAKKSALFSAAAAKRATLSTEILLQPPPSVVEVAPVLEDTHREIPSLSVQQQMKEVLQSQREVESKESAAVKKSLSLIKKKFDKVKLEINEEDPTYKLMEEVDVQIETLQMSLEGKTGALPSELITTIESSLETLMNSYDLEQLEDVLDDLNELSSLLEKPSNTTSPS